MCVRHLTQFYRLQFCESSRDVRLEPVIKRRQNSFKNSDFMNIERDLGTQPITTLLDRLQLTAGDLVQASDEQLTYKMVARAIKGRRLTGRAQEKVLRAVNRAADQTFVKTDLFNY